LIDINSFALNITLIIITGSSEYHDKQENSMNQIHHRNQVGIDRRVFLKAIGLTAASAAFPGCLGSVLPRSGQNRKPNVLFFFTDDQRFDTIAALGNTQIKTPNMDNLVRHGTTFTHAHIMGSMSGAVCMPSRAMLMTGRTLFHLGGSGRPIPPEFLTFPQVFQKAGYHTFGTGKWHNGADSFARSFNHGENIFFGGMSNHLKVPLNHFDPREKYPKSARFTGKKFSSNHFSDSAVDFLRQYDSDKPFLLYVSYTAPHDPRMAPKKYADMYPPDKIHLPKNFAPQHPFDNGDMRIRDEKLAPWPRTPKIVREHIAAYYAMITHVDAQIGRILQALKNSGQADNTIIVFAGDNGLAVGQHGLLGKQNLYEHSVRVPLVMGGPSIGKNKKSDTLCYLLDIFPTLCDLMDISIPDTVEGKSLIGALKNPTTKIRDSLFLAFKNTQRSVRTDRWKLIKYNIKGKQTTQLFDIENDPAELNNLAPRADHATTKKKLTTLLKNWIKKSDDPCTLDKPDWGFG